MELYDFINLHTVSMSGNTDYLKKNVKGEN